jgi:polyhydroxybutyrate depolymerase
MRTRTPHLFIALFCAVSSPAVAQSIDLGRGRLDVKVPASYTVDDPTPLMVLLRGYGSSGARHESYMKFGALVDSHDFLLVYPDGTEERSDRGARFWNASRACCNFASSTVDDSGYVMAIIDEMRSLFNVDANRVYLIGHSNGGFMSFRAAHEHSGTIAAIASLAGAAASVERGALGSPVHILQIHGTADETILYDGGEIQDFEYPGAFETVERWARYNGCRAEGIVLGQKLDLVSEVAGAETTATRYSTGCRAGGSAELWTIEGGAHTPRLSDSFAQHVVEWLLDHPKG